MKKVSTVKGGSFKNILVIIGSCIAIVLILAGVLAAHNTKEKEIPIVKVKDAVYVNGLIEEKNLYSYGMSEKEFNKSPNKYLTWDKREECIEQFATVYTKADGAIYVGDYRPTRSVRNEWMQEAEEGKLYISIPYDKSKFFGNILVPGDRVKINISYIDNKVSADGYGSKNEPTQKTLFDGVKIIDMLNAKGTSIYDYYTDLLAMSVSEREAQLRDESFLNDVTPKLILVEIDSGKGFDDYAEIQNYSGLSYVYGLYPRKGGDTVLDSFQELTRQITTAQVAVGTDSGK